jgi:uncharacterized repeat protein (TIGR02543 family)
MMCLSRTTTVRQNVANYTFAGWYTDSTCTPTTLSGCVNQYNFATPVAANLTLYAKWEQLDLTMSVPTVTINVSPGSSGIQQETTTVTVTTNNPDGYQLFLTMDATAPDNSLHTDIINPNTLTDHTLTATTSLTLANANEWGAKGGLVTNWTAVPQLATNPFDFKLADTTAPTVSTGEDTTVTFGANIAATTPAGAYTNMVLYTAIAKP